MVEEGSRADINVLSHGHSSIPKYETSTVITLFRQAMVKGISWSEQTHGKEVQESVVRESGKSQSNLL